MIDEGSKKTGSLTIGKPAVLNRRGFCRHFLASQSEADRRSHGALRYTEEFKAEAVRQVLGHYTTA